MVHSTAFLRPRLTGARFEDHAIPLEFLRDIAVLKELVFEVSKWKFLSANPDRQRVPRGFVGGVDLCLRTIVDGSAIPVIELIATSRTLFVPYQDYFHDAKTAIIGAISAAERDDDPSRFLPDRVLTYFQGFGRSLREGEAIELSNESQSLTCRLDLKTRRRLLLASTQATAITEEVSIRGFVTEVDDEKSRFHVRMADGKKIPSQLPEVYRDLIVEALRIRPEGVKILLEGIAVFDESQRLQRVATLENVVLLEPLDVAARIDEIRNIKSGWMDGQGDAPDETHLDWFVAQFETHYPDDLPLPYVYPTLDGGIQLEWTIDSIEISLSVEGGEHSAEWDMLDTESGQEIEKTLDLDVESDWDWIARSIKENSRAR
ncbi:hypothetical protein Mal4_05910 [Maioricimonas rarisocia]|uniref:Uncharacterized protein n=1 Tax=Maioricimonas rarisocia TaxID=2528026 RepID=A0A517Z1E2_9PLAN|nr:hypothetical protein [Maioricimonas rarisocia]QDU36306.1 hypothetical protein Mal4_05910 [Maioricimonas rarisocia]